MKPFGIFLMILLTITTACNKGKNSAASLSQSTNTEKVDIITTQDELAAHNEEAVSDMKGEIPETPENGVDATPPTTKPEPDTEVAPTTTKPDKAVIKNQDKTTQKPSVKPETVKLELKNKPTTKPNTSQPKNTGKGKTTTTKTNPAPVSPANTPKPTPPKPEKPKVDPLDALQNSAKQFLKKHVSGGRVAYNTIKSNRGELDALVNQIANADLKGTSSTKKQAFLINAYNISVIKSVVDNLPLASPLDKSGFFKSIKHTVAGESLTLDQLEKQKLFGLKNDARFHFVLVCAAIGCPRLENFAYSPSKLNTQLNTQTLKAINDPNFTKVNHSKKTVELSKIFEWYKSDFTAGGKTLLEYVNQYRTDKIPADYTVNFYEYNWQLNKK